MPTVKKYQEQKEREQIAYSYFINQGYSPEASAGIVGNLIYESGLNPKIEGDIGLKNGSSFGIAQFRGQRLKNLKNRYGDKWTDFNNQLDFVRHELETTHQKAGNILKNTKDVYQAGQTFSDLYEIPAKKYKNNLDRQKKVNSVYNSWSGQKYQPVSTPIADEAIRNVNEYFDSIPTTDVKDLEIVEDNSNLAEENEDIEPTEDQDIKEVQKQTAEINFLQAYKEAINQPDVQESAPLEQPVEQYQPQQNLTDIYNQVSEFIDSDVAQQGGKVYVNNTNDPRYKAYVDSLKLYQGTQRTLKELNSPEFKKENDNHIGIVPANSLYNEKNDSRVGFGSTYQNKGEWWVNYDKELELGEAKKYLNSAKIKPQSFYKSEFGSMYYRPLYKKPEQEVIVLNRPSVKPVNTLETEGLVTVEGGKINKGSQIINDYIQPKYWDVQDNVNQNFGGTQTNYRVYPETADQMLRTVAPEPYNTRKVTPYFQSGGTIQNSKDFLQNWYQERVLSDPALNQTYQNEKQEYVNQSMYLPTPNYVNKIDDDNTQGTYDIKTDTIDLLNTADPLVYTHEATHKINLPLKDTQSNVNAFGVIGQNIIPREKIENQWVKDNYQQISNYQEVIPRLNSYRQRYGLQPDQVITPELIQKNRELYQNTGDYEPNTDQLYKLFEDANLADTLNKVVSLDNSGQTYAQQGGLPISSDGVYQYPGQNVVVPTQTGEITMKNVNYPILGIDEFGNQQMMYPNQEYKFAGKTITEIPQLTENEKEFLKHISNG